MSTPQQQARGFLSGLLDFSFTSFITLRFIKVIYIVLMVLIAIGTLGFMFSGFSRGFGAGLFTLLLGIVGGFLYLVLARIYLELVAVLFRIGENTSIMAGQGPMGAVGAAPGFGGQAGPGSAGQGYPSPGGQGGAGQGYAGQGGPSYGAPPTGYPTNPGNPSGLQSPPPPPGPQDGWNTGQG